MSDHEKETVHNARKSLRTLQRSASSEENLVGRALKSLKHQHSQDVSPDVEVKKKNLSSKETQASHTNKITVEDLTNPESASENYWKILAEKRQITIEELMEENAKLQEEILNLKTELAANKRMLEEANSFIEVFKEIAQSDNDDTGIDVNDVSTADEPSEEDTRK